MRLNCLIWINTISLAEASCVTSPSQKRSKRLFCYLVDYTAKKVSFTFDVIEWVCPTKSQKTDAPTNVQYTEFVSVQKQDENTFYLVFDKQNIVKREETLPRQTR